MPQSRSTPPRTGDNPALRGEAPPSELRPTQFSVLAALALKGATPLGELADLLGLEHTSLTRSADRLKDKGWVVEAKSEDARERLLRLTPAGRSKVEDAYPAWKEAQGMIDGQLGRSKVK